jgi:hypothetical protein
MNDSCFSLPRQVKAPIKNRTVSTDCTSKDFLPIRAHRFIRYFVMTVIKSIEIISWAKIHALFGIVFGLIYGVLFAIMGTAIGAKFSMPGATTLGLLSIIVFPIIFGIMAFICGAILAFIYNIFAAKVGGIEIELAEKKA